MEPKSQLPGLPAGACIAQLQLPDSMGPLTQALGPLHRHHGLAADGQILFLRERLNRMLSEHTGQPMDVIERDTERDRFMSAEQSVEYGLVDQVITSR